MDWVSTTPTAGDMIRVRTSFYYHYGIFEDEEHVIAFGLPDNRGIDPQDIAVISTDIATFLNGGMCETARLSFGEKRKRLKPKATLAYAHEHLGMTGYDILRNNCEHFASACLFGEEYARSLFVDTIREEIRKKL